MQYIHFVWDEVKNRSNFRKHGVSFEEARTVFFDDKARIIHDPDHSRSEERFLLLGMRSRFRYCLSAIATVKVKNRFGSFPRGKPPRVKLDNMRGVEMRKEYNFSHSRRNPYVRKLKKAISIRIDPDTIEYFKMLAEETGMPYQNLMNHYLADCASKGLRPSLVWQRRVGSTVAGK